MPLARRVNELKAVASTGNRGCPAGGHIGAEAFAIVKALIRPAKSMISVSTNRSIPKTPCGTTGFLTVRSRGSKPSSSLELTTADTV